MPRKLLFLIADGMGDYPVSELEDLTPLEAARTPNMDYLASMGILGRCQTIPAGMPPGSDIANMSLLGYDPTSHHTGRGPIEAAAKGLDLSSSDLVYRLNLCTVSEFSTSGIMLDYCAGHIESSTANDLIADLNNKLQDEYFQIIPGMQYRHLLLQNDGTNSPEASIAINPPHDLLNQSLESDINAFSRSNKLSRLVFKAAEILLDNGNNSSANAIWPWGQGSPLKLPDFEKTYQYTGGVISAVDLIKGLGKAAGLQSMDVPGATGLLDTNYAGKVQKAREILQESDFVYLHVEAPDECGHSGNSADKIRAIQDFDQYIVGPLIQDIMNHNAACVIACDHLTPLRERTHTNDPVPFLFFDSLNKHNAGVKNFSEAMATASDIFIQEGYQLLTWTLKQMGAKDGQDNA
ncbi:MAG: cofactor-independent phosphoglycerate mutase [Thermodesulfobacteriota bacterium]